MPTIDRGDSHIEDAGGWTEACYHMGVFLLWAAKRGLAAREHLDQIERLSEAPGAYVVRACDTKLLASDFVADERVVRRLYSSYLSDYASLVAGSLGSSYVVGLDDALLATIEESLDGDLRRHAPELVLVLPGSNAGPSQAPATTERVQHRKFGVGVVVGRSVDGGRPRVTVDFEALGRKTILAEFLEPVAD